MHLRKRQITILGGGIGGLAVALALARFGAEVRVLEQAEALRETGAGIQISPNGMAVLCALGLGNRFREISTRGNAVSLRDFRAGREVLRLDLKRLAQDQEYRFVHRADLLTLLARAAREQGVQIRLLQRASSVNPGGRPSVQLAHGDLVEDDLVIGADGLHSIARAAVDGGREPFFTGQVAWRALVPNTVDHPEEARVYMGPGRHLVSYPVRGGAFVNLVAVEERSLWAAEGWTHTDSAENLTRAFARFGGPARTMLQQVRDPGLWGLFRHPVADRWVAPGLALMGDAAHPTLPFMAQGATMALEDAWVLAEALNRHEDQQAALESYQRLRRPRVVRVVDAADGNAWKYHLRHPVVRGVAHLGLGLLGQLSPGRMVRRLDWLYGYDVTRQTEF